jgi:hypothetical protein
MPALPEAVDGDLAAAGDARPASSSAPHATSDTVLPDSGGQPPESLPPAAAPTSTKNLALAALIVGIVALVLGWVPIVGLLLGALAIVFGIIALRRRQRKGLAITGIVLGGWGLITSVIAIMLFAVIAVQPQAFRDAFWTGYTQVLAGEVPAEEPAEEPDTPVEEAPGGAESDDAPVVAETAPALTDFAALDDAGFATVLADPWAAQGQTYIVYGEVQQFDENTGPCSALILVDDAQQPTWEGYATNAWIAAESGDAACPEFTGISALSHIKVWATVVGTMSTQWDDGSSEEVLTLMVRQYEALAALP